MDREIQDIAEHGVGVLLIAARLAGDRKQARPFNIYFNAKVQQIAMASIRFGNHNYYEKPRPSVQP